jgi:hypothetical protein
VLRDVAQVPLFNMFRSSAAIEDDIVACRVDLKHYHKVKIDLLHFIRAVFRRKMLAAGIVTIDLDFRYIVNPQLPPLEKKDKILFFRTCQMLRPQTIDWEAILGHRGVYGLLALLLTQLRNLRRLSFILPACADMKDKTVFFPLSVQTVQAMFPVLEDVSVSGACVHPIESLAKKEKDISDFVSIFAVPTLRKFHIDEFRLNRWCPSFFDPAGHVWQLSRLHLTNCISISARQFEEMISSFSNLEFLEFTIQRVEDGYNEFKYIEPGIFIRAIECHAQSLKNLRLIKAWYWEEIITSDDVKSKPLTIGSMHRFQKMETLHINASRVGSVCNLPPNLTRLVLRDNPNDWSVLVHNILQGDLNGRSICEHCPLLREVFVCATGLSELVYWTTRSGANLDTFYCGYYAFIPNLPYALYICGSVSHDPDQMAGFPFYMCVKHTNLFRSRKYFQRQLSEGTVPFVMGISNKAGPVQISNTFQFYMIFTTAYISIDFLYHSPPGTIDIAMESFSDHPNCGWDMRCVGSKTGNKLQHLMDTPT